MEQNQTEQGRRRWAGEALWEGQPTVSRAVDVTPAEGGRFRAIGRAGQKQAFEVSLRPEQLWRFRRQMERAGAVLHGLPSWTEPGPRGEPPPGRPPITDGGEEKPPPSGPKPFPDAGMGPGAEPLLLLADAAERRPVLPPGALGDSAIARVPKLEERLPRPEHLGDPGGNLNALSRQRWGVIAPQGGIGDELLEAIRPLVKHREEQQGAPVRVYQVPPTASIAEADRWVRDTYYDENVPSHERPLYLLVLGDLPQVSAELQQRLGASALVGRLCFDDLAGYRAYVEKVLRHEKTPPKRDARALFFTTHDGSDATSTGYHALVTPALTRCDEVPRNAYPVRDVLEVGDPDDWSSKHLLEAAREGDPAVLFTLSHGLGGPWSSPGRRRAMQGAMSFGERMEPLTADHVAKGPFLPGGAWFFLACLSAGTPSRSAYRPWLEVLKFDGQYSGRVKDVLESLPAPGEAPFIAALPRAALANPDGPMAIIGHLDLAWTYSFQDAYGTRRPSRFVEVLKQLWTGRRVGVAMKELLRFASETESTLVGLGQAAAQLETGMRPTPEDVHRGHLWMARNDLVGYVLLGDPAVRVAPARD